MDHTKEEFDRKYRSKLDKEYKSVRSSFPKYTPTNLEIPDSLNWVDNGVVATIKDQHECHASWAFASVSAVESHSAIKTGKLLTLSEQQLVDCTKNEIGCEGGYRYILEKGGIESDTAYPYTGKLGPKCNAFSVLYVVKLDSYIDVYEDENHILDALAKVGPITVIINSIQLQFYSGGIYTATQAACNPYDVDMAVTIVGYGTENGKPYWIIRNAWGSSWGENGYFRMERNKNVCGIKSYATYPVIK